MEKHTTKNIVSLLALIAALVILAILFKFTDLFTVKNSPVSTPDPITISGRLEGNNYYFIQENFEFTKLPDWTLIKSTEINLPKDLSGAQFALKKNDTECVMAYLHVPYDGGFGNYEQTSFGPRLHTVEKQQLDSSWYVHSELLNSDFKFQWEGKQPMLNEILIYNNNLVVNRNMESEQKIFILYDEGGDVVSDVCTSDFTNMLTSLITRYDQTKVDDQSIGIISVGKLHYTTESPSLFFVSRNDSIVRKVVDVNMDSNPVPMVYKNNIYFTQDGILKILNVFDQQITDIPEIKVEAGNIVNAFYIYNDKIFYLEGKSCIDYMERCNSKLYEFNLIDKTKTLLTENITSRNFVNYDTQNNRLNMFTSEGDAGCFWANSEAYDFQGRRIVPVDKYEGCISENETTENPSLKNFRSFIAQGYSQSTSTEYLLIDNGKINLSTREYALPFYPWNFIYIY